MFYKQLKTNKYISLKKELNKIYISSLNVIDRCEFESRDLEKLYVEFNDNFLDMSLTELRNNSKKLELISDNIDIQFCNNIVYFAYITLVNLFINTIELVEQFTSDKSESLNKIFDNED